MYSEPSWGPCLGQGPLKWTEIGPTNDPWMIWDEFETVLPVATLYAGFGLVVMMVMMMVMMAMQNANDGDDGDAFDIERVNVQIQN